ncbi:MULTISPECIES: bifunctional DNA primase/polymerase [unclassified Streptomyces]|uniref:bifunctional DNA primase/polymerase n=1 Tax=unclassified Streptomyces TaxID=2593676 RepID=UPI0037A4884A
MPADLWIRPSGRSSGTAQNAPSGSLLVAEWCAGRGWPVLPLSPGRKTPAANCRECRRPGHDRRVCSCRTEGRWCHGFHAATLDRSRIRQWWSKRPGMGVAVACGPAGLVVLDVDAHRAPPPPRNGLLPGIAIADSVDVSEMTTGFHTLAVLAALRNQPNPAEDTGTLRVRTPSGGLHVWYRAAGSRRWQSSVGTSGGRALAWQVDVRADGGYIVAPGTTTSAGTYSPVGPARVPARLPPWLAQELERTHHLPGGRVPPARALPARARQAVAAAGGGGTPAARALAGVIAEVTGCAAVPEGAGFSEKLNRAAYTAGGLAAAGHLSFDEAERLLRAAAGLGRPGQEHRCAQIIRGGLAAGYRHPLHPGSRR